MSPTSPPTKQDKAACTRWRRSLFSSAIKYKRSCVPRNPEQTTDPTREKQPRSACVMVDGHVLALTCRAASRKRLFWSSAAPRQAPPHAIMTTSPFHKEMCLVRTPRWHPANYRLRIIFSLQNIEIEHRASSRSLGCYKCKRRGFLGGLLRIFSITESVETKVFWVAFIGEALCQPENLSWGLRCGRMLTAASAKQIEQSGVTHQRNHSRAGPERQSYPNHATKSKATVERSGVSLSAQSEGCSVSHATFTTVISTSVRKRLECFWFSSEF